MMLCYYLENFHIKSQETAWNRTYFHLLSNLYQFLTILIIPTQNCCAEIIPAPGEPLVYRNVGADGEIEVKVNTPGVWGEIFPSHHPPLSKFLVSKRTVAWRLSHTQGQPQHNGLRGDLRDTREGILFKEPGCFSKKRGAFSKGGWGWQKYYRPNCSHLHETIAAQTNAFRAKEHFRAFTGSWQPLWLS